MDFPTFDLEEVPVTDAMEECFGARLVEAVMGIDLVCVFADGDAELVRTMQPDEAKLLALPGRIRNVTVRGESGVDCVSRSFCPKLAIYEDPVCGSAHCQIADYWSRRLGKPDIVAHQASSRGGTLYCHLDGDGRITIAGRTALFSIADLQVEPE